MPGSIHMLDRRVLIRNEVTPHTAESLTAADGIYDLRELGFLTPEIARIDKSNVAKASFGPESAEWDEGAGLMGFSLATPVLQRPAGSATRPSIAPLIMLAPMVEDLATDTAKAVYSAATPRDASNAIDSDSASAASIALYEAGKRYDLVGARSSFQLLGAVGKELLIKANPKAPYAAPSISVAPVVITKPSENTLKFSGALAITDNGSALDIGAFTLDEGSDMQPVPSSVSNKIMPMDYTPIITIDPLAMVSADDWTRLLAATTVHFIADFGGGKLIVDAPAGQLVQSTAADRNKRIATSQQWELTGTTPFTLTFA